MPASLIRRLAVIVALVAAIVVSAGCGSKTVTTTNAQGQATTQTVPKIHFAKTKFVLHGGLAYGAFHRYIYKPLQAGAFRSGAPGRTKALLKAGAAGLFVVTQLRAMYQDALSDDKLRPIANKINDLISRLPGLAAALKGGSADAAAITGAAGGLGGIVDAAKSAGVNIPLNASPSIP